jgi:cytochrome c oxidase assembly protein subunit 23
MPEQPSSSSSSTTTKISTKNEIDPITGKLIKDKISNDLNPGAGLTHNKGRPKPAPYSSDQDDRPPYQQAATFLTKCSKENSASLNCIERNYQNRAACNDFFQEYKDCRKKENDDRKAANAGSSSGWFW